MCGLLRASLLGQIAPGCERLSLVRNHIALEKSAGDAEHTLINIKKQN
jgi:hypothetical protein